MGLRSAVPLGGFGTGSFELRADGTFADWTIENQGTSLARDAIQNSKIPMKSEAFLGVWAQAVGAQSVAAAVRTAPLYLEDGPPIPGMDTLTYSGAFPFSRHEMQLPSLPVSLTLFSYSPFKLWDSALSAIPAVAFTAVIINGGTEAVNVSFMLSLPLGTSAHTDRPLSSTPGGGDSRGQTVRVLYNTDMGTCLEACAQDDTCTWYRHSGPGVPPVPAVTMPNNDCPGNDFDVSTRTALSTLDECIAQCNAVPDNTCKGLVWDQISGEQPSQCNNTGGSGLFCCLLKTSCTNFDGKQGDTAWTAPIPAIPGNLCTLYSMSPAVEQYTLPANETQAAGPRSGVKGLWSALPDGAGLTHVRNNPYDSSSNATWQDPACAQGDYTILSADATAGDTSVETSSSAGSSLAALWADFSADGILSGVPNSTAAAFGATAASAIIAAGAERTLTLVFSWYFPHRLFIGQDLGNAYATRHSGSTEIARDVSLRLPDIVSDGAAWNAINTNNTLPAWMQDFLINSLSTQVKMGVWVANDRNGVALPGGRYRQFEAFSNCDLDPMHVSSYHALPYTTLWPDLAANTLLTGWAEEQQPDGMIREFLGDFSAPNGRLTGPMDISAGGRTMADTTTVFILWTYGVFLSTGDETWLGLMYPSVSKAAEWQIARGNSGPNGTFPPYLQNTYDYLGLDSQPIQAYTGFLHLAAMRAVRALALVVGDSSSLSSDALASEQGVIATMQSALWTVNATTNTSFWRAYQTLAGDAPDAVMSGSLHGQNWASALGLGNLMPSLQLTAHVAAERSHNCAYDAECSLGLLTIPDDPGRSWATDATPAQSMDNTAADVWLQGASVLDGSPAMKVIEIYRTVLHDFWNWHDLHVGPAGLGCNAQLTGSFLAGTPFVNAHYARQLQGWSIQSGAVGQSWNAHTRVLRFSPASLREGDRLPFFTLRLRDCFNVGKEWRVAA